MSTAGSAVVARTNSVEATRSLAAALAGLARPFDLLIVVGDLGAGKTAFVQGFARGLEVSDRITSPTFALVQSYEGRIRMHHLDVYRLVHISETADLGLAELLDDEAVTLIEWGDTITSALPHDYLEVRLTADCDHEDSRSVTIAAVGAGWRPRLAALTNLLEAWAEPAPKQIADQGEVEC